MGKKWGWKKRENIVVKHYLLCVHVYGYNLSIERNCQLIHV